MRSAGEAARRSTSPPGASRRLHALAFRHALQCVKHPVVVDGGAGETALAIPPVVRKESVECFFFLHAPEIHTLRPPISEATQTALIQDLQRICGLSPLDAAKCVEELSASGAEDEDDSTQRQLKVLQARVDVLQSDAHPFYSPETYSSANYAKWKLRELQQVTDLMRSLIYRSPAFHATVRITVVEAKALRPEDVSEAENVYASVKVANHTRVTPMQSGTAPRWDHAMEFELSAFPFEGIEISLWKTSSEQLDSLLGELVVQLMDSGCEGGQSCDRWYTLDINGAVRLQISMQCKYDQYMQHLHRTDGSEGANDVGEGEEGEAGAVESGAESERDEDASGGRGTGERLEVADHHGIFLFLMESFVQKPSKSGRSGRTPRRMSNRTSRNIFSEEARWLLEQYGEVFGVERVYRQIALLHCCAQGLQPSFEHLYSVHACLSALADAVEEVGVTSREEALLQEAHAAIREHVSQILVNYYNNFPRNMPRGALSSAIDILRSLSSDKLVIDGLDRIVEDSISAIYKKISESTQEEASDKEVVSKLSKHSRLSSSGQVLLPEIVTLAQWRSSLEGFEEPMTELDKYVDDYRTPAASALSPRVFGSGSGDAAAAAAAMAGTGEHMMSAGGSVTGSTASSAITISSASSTASATEPSSPALSVSPRLLGDCIPLPENPTKFEMPDPDGSSAKKISAIQLILSCAQIMEHVAIIQDYFESSFPQNSNILACTLDGLYAMLALDVYEYCEAEYSLTDPTAFHLYFKLVELNAWRRRMPTCCEDVEEDMLPLSKMFYSVTVRWLNNTLSETTQWIARVSKAERLEPMSENVLHSKAAKKLFTLFGQSYEFLKSLNMGEPTFLGQFAEIVCRAASTYIQYMVLRYKSRGQQLREDFEITKELCTILNDIEHCKAQLSTLMDAIEQHLHTYIGKENKCNIYEEIKLECVIDTFHGCFKECFEYLDTESRDLLESIYSGMDALIRREIYGVVKSPHGTSPSALDPLYARLDPQIEAISFNLYSELFKKVLRKFWSSVINVLKDLLIPEDVEESFPTFQQIETIRTALEQLRSYFHADGQALPIQFIDNKALFITSLLQLYDQTTGRLVQLHEQQKDKRDQYLAPENIVKVLQVKALNGDDEAEAFVKTLQGYTEEVADDKAGQGCVVS